MLLLFLAAVLLMWWADIIQFILQAHHASHNALHGFGHGIREMSVVDIRDSNLLPLRNNRPARVAYHRAIHGHRLHHHAPGPYACVVSDYYRSQHLGPGSNDHIVANSGVALACLLARSTKRHALVQSDIVPYLRGLPYDLSLIHISEPTRLRRISYAVFCLKKKKNKKIDISHTVE